MNQYVSRVLFRNVNQFFKWRYGNVNFNELLSPEKISCRYLFTTPVNEHDIPSQEIIPDTTVADKMISGDVISKVNNHILNNEHGRLFAVIQLSGKQFKVTEEDLIVLEGHFGAKPPDVILVQKILLVAGSSFSLIGRPVVPAHIATVSATIVSHDLTHIRTHFDHIRRKRHNILNFVRMHSTVIRINKIKVYPRINEINETECIDRYIY